MARPSLAAPGLMARARARMSASAFAAIVLAAPVVVLAVSRAHAQAIEQGSLAELDPWAVGGLQRGETAFPRTLWRQSDPFALSALFDRVPVAPGSPAAIRIIRQTLLSPADAPSGDVVVAARKRYETLARLGAADEIVSMASGSGEAKRDPGIALYATQADLARGRLRDACRRAESIQPDTPPPFVLRLRALCFAEAGEKESADLALEVARSSGAGDAWLQRVIAVMTGAAPARAPVARYDTSLNAAASIAGKVRPPPTNALVNASAFALAIVASSEDAPAVLRAQAAMKALRQGAITPAAARAAGRTEAGSRTPSPLGLAVTEVEAASVPYAQALAIEGALKRAKPHSEFAAYARLFAGDIARLPLDPGTAPAAATFTRALLATGDYRGAHAWRRIADTVASDPGLLGILDVALTISRNDAENARFAADRRIETAVARSVGLVTRDLMVLSALDLPIGAAAQDFVTRNIPAIGRKPDPALMTQLTTAAERRAVGETAIYAALVLGDGAEGLDAVPLVQVIAALRAVGLSEAARVVAIEATIAGQAR